MSVSLQFVPGAAFGRVHGRFPSSCMARLRFGGPGSFRNATIARTNLLCAWPPISRRARHSLWKGNRASARPWLAAQLDYAVPEVPCPVPWCVTRLLASEGFGAMLEDVRRKRAPGAGQDCVYMQWREQARYFRNGDIVPMSSLVPSRVLWQVCIPALSGCRPLLGAKRCKDLSDVFRVQGDVSLSQEGTKIIGN